MIGVLGDLNLEFPTHRELQAEINRLESKTEFEWIPTDAPDAQERAARVSGLWVIPGTPYKADEVVYRAIKNARENDTPFLGSCGGFQYALVEYARNVVGINDAVHAETHPDSGQQIIQGLSCSLIGEERTVRVVPDTQLADICGPEPFTGHHYCNYGLAGTYQQVLSENDIVFNSHATDAGIEGFELPDKKFFIATLFQPQVGALAGKPRHPLISAFLAAAS